jgi:serine/threonine protein kinase
MPEVASLEVLGEFEGPGERKTAERLAAELPDSWVIFAGRKLPGANRDDVDLLVVGEHRVFVLEEKAWGPRIVADDNQWLVGAQWRANPLNRNGQLARKVAGLLRERVTGYAGLRGRHVLSAVVLSHDRLSLHRGAHHDTSERIFPLATASAELTALDAEEPDGIRSVRSGVLGCLRGMPAIGPRPQRLGEYILVGRAEVPGTGLAYTAESSDGQVLILKCYNMSELAEHGDPRLFLERETRALNRLAEVGRTWRALPYFSSDEHDLFVVPLIPPRDGRNLRTSWQQGDPARPDGRLEEVVARKVAADAFRALDEVHDLGLVHRALHPRRVWLGRGLRVLFSDFHLARIAGEVSVAAWAPDYDISDDYRAPECATNVATATAASDVFSLALCVAEWLLGIYASEVSHAHLREELHSQLPWAEVLAEALASDPSGRPSAADLAEGLRANTAAPETPGPAAPVEIEEGVVVDGRYEVKRKLGKGGFAHTWLVYDKQSDQAKVLKAFLRDLPAEAIKEYRSAEKLKHDRCARVYDVQTAQSPNYLVSEYVEGSCLADVQPPPDVEQLRGIALDVLTALEYIHGKELVHGDVTPTNVIVDSSMRATLIDFGLSVSRGEQPAGWHPRFCAPEARNGRPASAASDLYGLSASMIYVMLGRDAVRHDGPGAFTEQPPTPAEEQQWGPAGTALMSALFEAVKADPKSRPASAGQMRERLKTARPVDPPPTDDDFQVNRTVDALRRLYRASVAGNGGNRGLDDDFARTTYVPTLLDTELKPRVLAGDLSMVLLTGNPGDGKTSFLVSLGEELKQRGANTIDTDDAGWHLELAGRSYRAVFDASESHGSLSSDELVLAALRPAARAPDSSVALIAVNDGRLRQLIDEHEHEFEAQALAIRAQIDGRPSPDPRIAVVDLKRRSLAGTPDQLGLAERALAELTKPELWEICGRCRARAVCPILANRNLLAGPGADAFGGLVLASHLRRRRRATFRDLRSAAAWTLTGDRSCGSIHELIAGQHDPRFLDRARAYDLAFDPDSRDYLIDEWALLDPAAVAAPAVDALRRQGPNRSEVQATYRSTSSVARGLFFGDWTDESAGRQDLMAYRYLGEFLTMLTGDDPERTRARLLLGASRLVGAFGFHDRGLAIRAGTPDSEWSVLRVVAEDRFTVDVAHPPSPYVEVVPDTLVLKHANGPRLALTLDTAEVILRAADGEIVDDLGSDSIRQEIDGFVNQLSREPSASARIVDSAGTVAIANRVDTTIQLELPA